MLNYGQFWRSFVCNKGLIMAAQDPNESFEQVNILNNFTISTSLNLYFCIFLKFEDEDLGESTYNFESTSAGRKRLFSKELRCMMYGFGDDQNPYTESVDLLEDLVIEFIIETTHR